MSPEARTSIESQDEDVRVSSLELFFDLVFVFTITQLTATLAHHPTAEGLLQVVLMLVVIWWMYSGYAWLTNAIPPERPIRRLFLLGGMACFLVISLAIPTTFSGDGVVFAAAYLAVICFHTGLYVGSPAWTTFGEVQLGAAQFRCRGVHPRRRDRRRLRVGVRAVGARARAHLDHPARASRRGRPDPLELALRRAPRPGRDRGAWRVGGRGWHRGVGAAAQRRDARRRGARARAQRRVVVDVLRRRRGRAGRGARGDPDRAQGAPRAHAYYYAHLLILLGIIADAAGLERAIAHPFDPLALGLALALGGGSACFFVGDVLFRRSLGMAHGTWRLVAAALALATVPLGTEGSALLQLAALVVAVAGCLLAEHLPATGGSVAESP